MMPVMHFSSAYMMAVGWTSKDLMLIMFEFALIRFPTEARPDISLSHGISLSNCIAYLTDFNASA